MTKRKHLIVSSCAFALSFALPALVLAAEGFVPLTKDADFQKIFGVGSNAGSNPQDLSTFISGAFKVTLSIGAILAVLRIAYAGYQYMSSDAWGEKSHAKEILGDVTIGILLLLSVWLILNQINPNILQLKISGVNSSGGSSGASSATTNTGTTQARTQNPTNVVRNTETGDCTYYDAMGVAYSASC